MESVILTPSIINYHSEGPPIFNRNAESQRAFVLQDHYIVIYEIACLGPGRLDIMGNQSGGPSRFSFRRSQGKWMSGVCCLPVS